MFKKYIHLLYNIIFIIFYSDTAYFATLDLEFLVVDCLPKNMQPDRLSAIPGMLTTSSNNAADQCLQGPGNTQAPYSHN